MNATSLAIGHHGEILQGVFRDDRRRLHRGLVSLPFAHRFAIARVRLSSDRNMTVVPGYKKKSLVAMQLLCGELGYTGPGFELSIRSNIPEGYGLGSSTADIVATLRAVARYLGHRLTARVAFRIAVKAETASDSTMFTGRARLVCQREGTVLERYAEGLPPFSLLSVNVAPDDPVGTLAFPAARYTDDEIDEFAALRDKMRRAISEQDLSLLGKVAKRSSVLNQRRLPQPHFEEIRAIARSVKAAGVQVAHSGRMVGIILNPTISTTDARFKSAKQQLIDLHLLPEFYSA
ncbi:GHMP kinase [Sinorhizobium meliloti]|uniref:GHMP family kinase ATP-binding protein n=1 Tax=Rhizobium meliloti TaxID=382 RepID=UPI0003DCE29F|nr:GHMP kinase [Sinorhizobium meliloti]ARS65908.1 GHMP kinase [Sinorhizobium meliloti RU11/001]RVG85631.1 GHMP kinase [Sinorhizobium meliloti]RVH56715.1 GHMP kinase [Sinorhizobium meliloti]